MERYEVDKELAQAIVTLCDIALKQGGLNNKQLVDFTLSRFNEKKPKLETPKEE